MTLLRAAGMGGVVAAQCLHERVGYIEERSRSGARRRARRWLVAAMSVG